MTNTVVLVRVLTSLLVRVLTSLLVRVLTSLLSREFSTSVSFTALSWSVMEAFPARSPLGI